ncbi:MAG: alpha/beta hydrolase [Clostridia bacterium]|nr:alpha/beta hydrolase [Clostridia bacterium]
MKNSIFLKENVLLNDLLQAIQIKGQDIDNPLLLMIHGGPGCAETGISASYQAPWEERYTVVNWDQRYVGATALLSGTNPEGDFTLDDIVEDAHQLCLYLLDRFRKEKLVVLGHSWGSIVGSLLTSRYPELFYGFIGWGQVVNMVKNEQVSIAHTRELAEQTGDDETIRNLDALMPYPDVHDPLETMMKKIIASTAIKYAYGYGSVRFPNVESFSAHLVELAKANPDYPDEAIAYMDNALAYAVIFTRDVFTYDLLKQAPVFTIPVLFVFGDNDWQTPFPLGEEYLNLLQAPYKSFHLIANSGHSTTLDNPDDFADYLVHTAYEALLGSR